MRTLAIIVLTLAVSLTAAPTENPASYVDLRGCPILATEVLPSGLEWPFARVTLQHTLLNLGNGYRSEVYPPEVSSYFIQTLFGRWQWRQLDGTILHLRLNVDVAQRGRLWRARIDAAHAISVVDKMSNERFIYRRGLLWRVEKGHKICEFIQRTDQTVCSVSTAGKTEGRLTIDYDENRRVKFISSAAGSGYLEYNHAGQLTVVQRSDGGMLTFSYERGLLARITNEYRTTDFAWGDPEWVEYARPPRPVEPVVARANLTWFRVQRTTRWFAAEYGEKKLPVGGWQINEATGTTRFWHYNLRDTESR